MGKFCKCEEYKEYDDKSDKKPINYKKDECGNIKIYTHTVNIHINCKSDKY